MSLIDDISSTEKNEVVQLNVGGTRYTTTIATLLTRETDSFFSQLLAPNGLEIYKKVYFNCFFFNYYFLGSASI